MMTVLVKPESFRKTSGGLTTQAVYEITLWEEFRNMNKLTRTIMFSSCIQTSAWRNKSIVDSLEGTIIWEYNSLVCLKFWCSSRKAL